MNKENFLKLASVIREHETQFSLKWWAINLHDPVSNLNASPLNNCNTVCCICGWANTIRPKADDDHIHYFNYGNMTEAAKWLEISLDFAKDLFTPDVSYEWHVLVPYQQAVILGLYPAETSAFYCNAQQAAAILEAIADGRIRTY